MKRVAKIFQGEKAVYLFAIGASLLLSWWLCYRETVINSDAICYLLSAKAIGAAGLRPAMQLCGQAQWPFYSFLLYGLAQFSHLPSLTAAYLIDGLFSTLSVLTFILIVKELLLSSTKIQHATRILWLAAFVILLAHTFNSVRVYIVRDHGFWTFYLGSLFFLLRFFRLPRWKYALAWNFCLLIAALFRIEGVVFLLAIPFFALLLPLKHQAKCFFMLNTPTILIAIALGAWLFVHPQAFAQLGRLPEVFQQLQHGIVMLGERYQANKVALVQHVLTPDSAREAGLILFLTLFAAYLVNVIANLSIPYLLLVLYAWWHRAAAFHKGVVWLLSSYLMVNVAVTLTFYIERLFLSKRYLIALSLVLMLWVPFALNTLWQERRRLLLGLAALFIAAAGVSSIIDFGYSKSYIHDAGNWLAANVPAQAALYANDGLVMYYSGHFGDSIFTQMPKYAKLEKIAHGQWKHYDYLALRLNKHAKEETTVLQEINRQPIKIFSNVRGDKVIIYQVTGDSR
jgi:hypothetical protein